MQFRGILHFAVFWTRPRKRENKIEATFIL